MNNANANVTLSEMDDEYSAYDFDLSELESQLENDLSDKLANLEMSEEERKNIGNPDKLGTVVYDTVMNHINSQIAGLGAEEFVANNNEKSLDLRSSAHIQTTKNFAKGKIAKNNSKIDYQDRYDKWQNSFEKDEDNSSIKTKKNYDTGELEKVLRNEDKEKGIKSARYEFDSGRDKGSASVHKDHTISVAEIIRDPHANAHLDKEEQIKFANSDKNLGDLDSSANSSKGDRPMTEWLEKERNGQKNSERFNIDEEELRKRDKIAREEFERITTEGERKSIETGKQSQKDEAKRMAASASKAIGIQFLMTLLKDFLKEVTFKLIAWFKSGKKKIETFLSAMKDAIHDFVTKLRKEIGKHVKNALDTGVKLLVGAIFKPMARIIRRFGAMITQGFKSIKEAIAYLRDPANKNKPFSIKAAQVGKIVVAGLTGAGAILFGQAIESGISIIPVVGQFLAFEIPLIGSLSSLIGLFMGALISGVLGAIVLNMIDKFIARRLEQEAVKEQITKGNEALVTQYHLAAVRQEAMQRNKHDVNYSIRDRHLIAADQMRESISKKESIEKEVKQRAEERIERQRIDGLKFQEELKIDKEKYFIEELKAEEEIKEREEKRLAAQRLMKDELEKIKEKNRAEEKKLAERSKPQGNSINQNDSNNFDFDELFEQLNKL